jgi:hypothetical protein
MNDRNRVFTCHLTGNDCLQGKCRFWEKKECNYYEPVTRYRQPVFQEVKDIEEYEETVKKLFGDD